MIADRAMFTHLHVRLRWSEVSRGGKLAVGGLLLVGAIVLVRALVNPLHWTEPMIHGWILRQAPLGSAPEVVYAVAEERGWQIRSDREGPSTERGRTHYPGVDGTRVLHVYLGGYRGLPFWADVDCFFGFTATEGLVDLRVRKMYDAL